MNGKTFKQQIYLISEYLYNKEGHIAGAKSGAFEFDYSKEKPTLTLKKTDELAWLCITQNVQSLIKLSHITDEWEDGQTPAGFFANDTSIDTFEQSVQESGMSKKDYLAQWGFTEKQNFTLSFKDEHNIEKINLLHFNADKQGNYIVTAKKMDLSHFQRMKYVRVVAGIEPAIHSDDTIHSTKSRGITTQTDKIISQNPNKSQAILQYDGGMALKSIRELEAKKQENLQTMQESIDEFKKENKVRKI